MTRDEFQKLSLPNEHYLKVARELGHNYFDEFISTADKLRTILKPSDFKIFWNEKMQLNKNTFIEKGFIQGACEAAVSNYFSDKDNFGVEVRVNPNNKKDVDCQFESQGFRYNIEVKCASFDEKEKVQSSDSFKFQTYGRLPDKDSKKLELSKAIDEGLTSQGKELKEHQEIKNMDNNLKDFLMSAHEKFNSNAPETEINILLLGCDDPSDMQSWVGYLYAEEGLFTQNTFADKNKYNNVDIVVLTNLYFKHKDFVKKSVKQSWTLSNTLNLIICNPLRAKNKEGGIRNFFNEIVNYNDSISKFEVPGDAPPEVKAVVKMNHFVIDYLEKENKIFLFQNKDS